MSKRDQGIRIMEELDLSGFDYPDRLPVYLDFLVKEGVEKPELANALKGMSSCALILRAYWRDLGAKHPVLHRPYRNGMAPTDCEQIAGASGARVQIKVPTDRKPAPGDAFFITHPTVPGKEHFEIIMEVLPDPAPDTWAFRICGGGKGKAGANVSSSISHWKFKGGRAWVGDRYVVAWYDLDKVLAWGTQGLSTVEQRSCPSLGSRCSRS